MELKKSGFVDSENKDLSPDNIINSERTFAELFGLSPEDFNNMRITNSGLSNRIINILMRSNISTVASLLMCSPVELSCQKNTGSKSVIDIIRYIQGLTAKYKVSIIPTIDI